MPEEFKLYSSGIFFHKQGTPEQIPGQSRLTKQKKKFNPIEL